MGNFNPNYQPIDDLGSVNQVGNSYNPMSGVNLNAGPSHKQASESPLILDPQPVIQQKQPMTAQSGMYTHTQTQMLRHIWHACTYCCWVLLFKLPKA